MGWSSKSTKLTTVLTWKNQPQAEVRRWWGIPEKNTPKMMKRIPWNKLLVEGHILGVCWKKSWKIYAKNKNWSPEPQCKGTIFLIYYWFLHVAFFNWWKKSCQPKLIWYISPHLQVCFIPGNWLGFLNHQRCINPCKNIRSIKIYAKRSGW